jgi:ABC-type long-subunit fatty acid transport system fused permease/ATPase subunit
MDETSSHSNFDSEYKSFYYYYYYFNLIKLSFIGQENRADCSNKTTQF